MFFQRLRKLHFARILLVLVISAVLLSPSFYGSQQVGAASKMLAGWSFVVDPGHGGSDNGAVGPTGFAEKVVNLNVALKLRDLLESEGAVVYMTRTTDTYVSIRDRYTLANNLGVDRFISVHHNSYSDPNANYTVTLISTAAGDVTYDLAIKVQNELLWELGLPSANPPVWRVNYVGVLNNTNMPAILTEASFISNAAEEQRLKDPHHNQREAEAIFRGVLHHCGGPHAYFIEPEDGAMLFGTVDLKLSVLNASQVQRVNYYVDGQLEGTETVSPYRHQMDTTKYSDGTHFLKGEVVYNDGFRLEANTSISIANNAARKWYFAEGTTRPGFEEWVTIINPNDVSMAATVTYCFNEGQPLIKQYYVGNNSRISINVNGEVGAGKDVAIQISTPYPVVAERPMYVKTESVSGGHTVLGVNKPSNTWYFAEGFTGEGFEEWLCLYNPNDYDISVNADYLMEDNANNLSRVIDVPKKTRVTQKVNQVVGPNRGVSIRLNTSNPSHTLVAERTVSFNYSGKWKGVSAAMGVTAPATSWYFAEGCTRKNFEEWLCIQNPNDVVANVKVTYYNVASGSPIEKNVPVAARTRKTVFVNSHVANMDVSIKVESDRPVVAERPIYFNYSNGWAIGGDVGSGSTSLSPVWYFSEGCNTSSFEEFICILNPQTVGTWAKLVFYLPGGDMAKEELALPPRSRVTVAVKYMVYAWGSVSVCVLAGQPVMVERPIYFKYQQYSGGSNCCGYYPLAE